MGPVNGKVYLDEKSLIRTPDLKNEPYSGGLGLFYFNQMTRHKSKIAQIDAATGKQESYQELLKRSIRTAINMKCKGIAEKDIITFCSYNHMDLCVAYIATFFLGAIPTALDPSMSVDDVAYLLNLVKPKMIFVVPEAVSLVEDALEANSLQAEVISFGAAFSKLLVPNEGEEIFKPYNVKDSRDTAIILFSSGTTGLPKGICVNHYSLLNILENQVKGVDLNVALSYSSFYWITSTSLLIATMFTGNARLIVKEFDAQEFWHYIDKYKVSFIFLNLNATQSITHIRPPPGLSTTSVKQYITAGEFVSPTLLQQTRKRFADDTAICQLYGLTEASGFVTSFCFKDPEDCHLMDIKLESCGRPMPGFDYKIVDVESGRRLGPNQPGELRLKSKYIMNGYYNMDSSSVFDEEGFLKTGDVLYYDEDLCFFVVDRIKEMLKFKGWHVTPQVIEKVLLEHPAVSGAVVVGVPDENDGEHPMACIVLKKDSYVSEEALKVYVNERVDDRKKLRGGVQFVDSFPRTVTGKVNRRVLKLMYGFNRSSSSS